MYRTLPLLPCRMPCCWDFDLEREVFEIIFKNVTIFLYFFFAFLGRHKEVEMMLAIKGSSRREFWATPKSLHNPIRKWQSLSRENIFLRNENEKKKSERKYPQLLNWIKTLTHTHNRPHEHIRKTFSLVFSILCCYWLTNEYVYGWWCQGCGLGRSVWMSIKVNDDTHDMSRYLAEFPVILASPRSSSAPHTTTASRMKQAMTHLGKWKILTNSFSTHFSFYRTFF